MKYRHYLSTMAIAALISLTACKDDYTEDHAASSSRRTPTPTSTRSLLELQIYNNLLRT